MDARVLSILEYDKIKAMLADMTQSRLGRELVERLQPLTLIPAIESALQETSEAQALLSGNAQVPLRGLSDARDVVAKAERGGVLAPAELLQIADLVRGGRELRRYMGSKRAKAPTLSRYAEAIADLRALEDEIYGSIEETRVASAASPKLAKIRREIEQVEERIQARLQSFLNSAQYRDAMQENFVGFKEGRYVLPVKASHRNRVDGLVVSTSGSGSTVFIEPAAVRRLVNDLQTLRGQEEAEEYQILTALSGLVAADVPAIRVHLEVLAAYDFALAKGRLSLAMGGRSVAVNADGFIQILQGRHPLITQGAVPLDLVLGRRYRTLVITGPNTGGKTVALKTAGLLTLMAQSGLHVPVGEGSRLAVFDMILADIGDGQSIEQSLSTFSAHMGQIASTLAKAGPRCLVLLDELGTGTDPAEGAALAMAILEDLHRSGAVTLATTHYSDVKRLADAHPGFLNGRMDFDRETLRPLYRLILGESGSSHALWIAERLGVPKRVLDQAGRYLGGPPSEREVPPRAKTLGAVEVAPAPEAADDAKEAQAVNGTDAADAAPDGLPGREQAQPAGAAPARGPRPWQLGDYVRVEPLGQNGVVAELPNARGEMIVFTRGKRISVNHKRVSLLVEAQHLYPEGYDLTTATYTWEDRRFMKRAAKGHVEGVRVISEGAPEA
ncbi:MAG: endonuclease MutS2 [Bacillota bacterium]